MEYSPIEILEPSESRTEPYIILDSFPMEILPITAAVGAINTVSSILGSKPRCFIIILFHLILLSSDFDYLLINGGEKH